MVAAEAVVKPARKEPERLRKVDERFKRVPELTKLENAYHIQLRTKESFTQLKLYFIL